MPIVTNGHILTINAGSSSIKFALFDQHSLQAVLRGAIADIGGPSSFRVSGAARDNLERHFAIPDHITATNVLLDWLAARAPGTEVAAVAYRIVYGGPGCAATRALDPGLIDALYAAASSEPAHLPQQLHLIDALRRHAPAAAHLACFDSAFHASMPPVASTLPIPRRYHALGIRRYGFHGLACASVMRELARSAGPDAAAGKVIIAHLGGGSSVTAVEGGRSRDTTMGLTPAGGIMMGKRSGDLDPGLAWRLARQEQMSAASYHHMVNHQSGLLGVSGSSADLRVLAAAAASDSRAAEAVELYCYAVRKSICAMAGAIDGIGTLVFSGGAGRHSAEVRERVCSGLAHLGVALDAAANRAGAPLVSAPHSRVVVRVLDTDEEAIMGEEAQAWLARRNHDLQQEGTAT